MPRRSSEASISSIIEEAVRPVVARVVRDLARAIDAAPRRAAAPARAAGRRGRARARRPRGEMSRWVADRTARRVPTFVIEATGLDTKKAIVARFGEDAAFEKGKPLPKQLGGASVRATGKDAARTVKARPPVVRKAQAPSR